jgi:uncharacterized protein
MESADTVKTTYCVTTKQVTTSDEQKIAFDQYVSGQERAIVIAPGFYNSKEALLLKDLADYLANDGYDVFLMDFRGHGSSSGLFNWTSREYLDLLAVVGYVQERYKKIGVIGFSLGAATALIAAVKSAAIHSLIAISPPAEFEKIEYRFWELSWDHDIHYSLLSEGRIGKGVKPGPFWLAKEKPRNVVRKLKQPVFYIHGTEDWLIKPWHSEVLYGETSSAVKRREVISGAPHAEYMLRTHREDMVRKIHDWFQETL